MVDTANDALQSHKVSGENAPRGRVSGQKSLKNSEILEKLSPARGGGTGVGNHFGTMQHISVIIYGTLPKLLWWIALVKVYKPTKFRGETYQGAGSAGKKVLEILKTHEIMSERGRMTIEP